MIEFTLPYGGQLLHSTGWSFPVRESVGSTSWLLAFQMTCRFNYSELIALLSYLVKYPLRLHLTDFVKCTHGQVVDRAHHTYHFYKIRVLSRVEDILHTCHLFPPYMAALQLLRVPVLNVV